MSQGTSNPTLGKYSLLRRPSSFESGIETQLSRVLNFPESGLKIGTMEERFSVMKDSMQKSKLEFWKKGHSALPELTVEEFNGTAHFLRFD